MNRSNFLRAAAAAALFACIGSASAQAYPNKPVKVIIPFPPGGTLDFIGRSLAQKMSESTGQTFVVENRPGGNGFIGADAVAKAPNDGYTLLFNASTFTTGPMVAKAPYDVQKDFSPVVLVAQAPLALSVNNDLPVKDVAGLIAYAKANPGKLNFAIGSTGSAGHLSTELLKRAGGLDITIVPYKGTAPAMQDLVGGQIQGFIDPLLGAMNFHKTGKLRIIALTSKNRVPNLPEVPTVGDTVAGYEFYSWYGLWAPAGTAPDVVAKLNAEANKALASDMKQKLVDQGLIVNGGSVADIVKFQSEDMAKSQKIITEGNIRAQ
ncbi:Bug family tripartite tricarboxylate transporter substrate binding protein [Sphaerotilus mobilis]|uniref:Tripartite-type tricarboxylate transporter receptor subunit TctC n=1 Tax=Sphaerotilus mobilis TaxID=47994 RepID=A0A4Q7LH52_9BURK|nr:tripartite tricarboxylate transporter substrate binding protein [Sphaerotilus mobilis]RZS53363.1 tripartite-type tricarboxylate transporter receptor subunit TctC [Sphaerotilus mobilis]